MKLDTPVQYVKGVGPAIAQRLERLGILTVGQLICHYPRRYIDYTQPCTISQAPSDAEVVIRAQVLLKKPATRIAGGRTLIQLVVEDETSTMTVSWFNTQYMAQQMLVGETYYFVGRVRGSASRREMTNPTVRTPAQVARNPLSAIYPQTEGLSSGVIARCIQNALAVTDPLPEPLPPDYLSRFRMPDKWTAVRHIHQPSSPAAMAASRRRLVFEELFVLQLGLSLLKSRGMTQSGAPMRPVGLSPFWESLPFSPTSAQKKASEQICADMTGKRPMNRLLQGDVGSGKTLVAAAATYMAAQNGYQTALMAPTEILATQHASGLQKLLEPFGIQVALLTGGMRAAARRATLEAIASGEAQLVVGTHAVIGQKVEFAQLGLVVVDEQHRFGVQQRGLLADKARSPHVLVMSATPIPRTLGLLMYGDLDISILDELPPGRKPVKTYAVTQNKRRQMYHFLDDQIEQGRQAYIVCPLVEESTSENPTTDNLHAVTTYYTDVAQALLPNRRIGLMHGKLKAKEKAQVMEDFKSGKLDALVSTTVIEVGVDVPNASVIVIENAERYGLSALHQLRGRVGRGNSEAFCILVSDHGSSSVKERLHFLCQTQDGFEVARYDLEHRGPGDFFGNRQHGLPTLQLADLMGDTRVLEVAQDCAHQLLQQDPKLKLPEHAALADAVQQLFERTTFN